MAESPTENEKNHVLNAEGKEEIQSERRRRTMNIREPEKEKDVPNVLEPDHPLLEKFQIALKEHLERQIQTLREDVFELETQTKKTEASREELGIEAYEIQQISIKQQAELDECLRKIQNIVAAREETEHEFEELKTTHKKTVEELVEAEKSELELRTEMESMNLLLGQMAKYENDIESNLLVNQRISEKTKKDKQRLLEEKRQQDLLVYKWMTNVWSLENELETMNLQLRVKEAEREKLAQTVTECTIELEAFETEYRCLLHAWNSVVIAIGYRDKHYNTIKQDVTELESEVINVIHETVQVKKACNKELEINETFTLTRSQLESEIKSVLSQLEEVNQKREVLEKKIYETQVIIDQIDKDIEQVEYANVDKNRTLEAVIREVEKVAYKKVQLEEEVLKQLQEKLLNSKEANYLAKLIKKRTEKKKSLDISLAMRENEHTKYLLETETQKYYNEDLKRLLDDLHFDQDEIMKSINHFKEDTRHCGMRIHKKQRDLDIIIKKIERQQLKLGDNEASPLEQRNMQLEKNTEDIQAKNKELQKYWLREQGHMVSLSEQRQNQLHELNFLRKQTLILQQKNLKIEDEFNLFKKQEEDIYKLIGKARNHLVVLDDNLNKKRDSKTKLGKQIDLSQQLYMGKLKDEELECLSLEADIAKIEEDKQNLTKKLLELNREALEWEKKLQMALETKQNMRSENKEGGEVDSMKAEIHRMNVRYSQLKKAQEKLISDLEHCVARRDSILTTFEAREKKAAKGQDKVRINFNRKLDDMRNKLKKLDNEIVQATKTMEEVEEERTKLENELEDLQNELEQKEKDYEMLHEEMENLRATKQTTLFKFWMRQKKLQLFTELYKGRRPERLYRNERVAQNQLKKQEGLNLKLFQIIDNLKTDFPLHKKIFDRLSKVLTVHIDVTTPDGDF